MRFGRDRAVETVYLRGYAGKRMLGRWYDKGLESNTVGRGLLVRGEDQRRWGKYDRRNPEECTAEAVRRAFQRRFLPLYKATKGVTVTGPLVIVEKLVEAVEAGELTPGEADAVVAEVAFAPFGGNGRHRTTRYRRQKLLRERVGLVVADGVLEEVEVEVGAVLEAALETDAWERRG